MPLLMSEQEDAEQYLPAEWSIAKFDSVMVKKDDVLKVTYTVKCKCLHCSKTAIASCLVEDAEMVLQLVCENHIQGTVIWRKE